MPWQLKLYVVPSTTSPLMPVGLVGVPSTGAAVQVAGAGIGGLAAALALVRQGIAVKVLEQSPEIGEIGAGIQLGLNAFRPSPHISRNGHWMA